MAVDVAEPRWCGEAAALLRLGVPEACHGLTPYDSHYFSRYLATAGSVPESSRTLFLRGELDRERLLAVADWRLVGSVLWLHGIGVLPSAMGRGLGRSLLSDGLRLAGSVSASALETDQPVTNAGVPRLFGDAGFRPAGRSVWCELSVNSRSSDPPDEASWRIRNWPHYAAQLQAYGFADLEVVGPGAKRVMIQVLPGGWRVSRPDTAASLVRALGPVVGHRPGRVFTVASGSASGGGFASFHRLRRPIGAR